MRGDEAELYRVYAAKLEAFVRRDVRTTPENVQDACHFAWVQLLRHSERVDRETAFGWLARTATREALKLHRRQTCAVGDAIDELVDERAVTDVRVERLEQLALVDALPERQRRMLWLRASGLGYREISAITGDSTRTVERQVLRGSRRLEQRRREYLAPPPPPSPQRPRAAAAAATRGRKPIARGL